MQLGSVTSFHFFAIHPVHTCCVYDVTDKPTVMILWALKVCSSRNDGQIFYSFAILLLGNYNVKFNSIKCGRNVTVDSEVPLVSHLIQNRYCRVCWSAENVLNTEYSIWGMNILSDKGLKFGQNLSANRPFA